MLAKFTAVRIIDENTLEVGIRVGKAGLSHYIDSTEDRFIYASEDLGDLPEEVWDAIDIMIRDDGESHPYVVWSQSAVYVPDLELTLVYVPLDNL